MGMGWRACSARALGGIWQRGKQNGVCVGGGGVWRVFSACEILDRPHLLEGHVGGAGDGEDDALGLQNRGEREVKETNAHSEASVRLGRAVAAQQIVALAARRMSSQARVRMLRAFVTRVGSWRALHCALGGHGQRAVLGTIMRVGVCVRACARARVLA
eukprot:6214492-Pleurochrysis_carterae.AAC.3